MYCIVFFFNDTATTEIYTLSLHDALPIYGQDAVRHPGDRLADQLAAAGRPAGRRGRDDRLAVAVERGRRERPGRARSEEHTSELQSRQYLVCRLLLEQKKNVSIR